MTLEEADVLLGQWADWSADELDKLDFAASPINRQYQSGFVEEDPSNALPAGDEQVMVDVDTALGVVKIFTPYHYHVIRGRYKFGESYNRYQLDSAKRAFIAEFVSPLDNDFENSLSLMRGIARP